MENIMGLYECKFNYLNLVLEEISKKYSILPSFRLSLPYKYEITTSMLFETKPFSEMQDGLYLITNIWGYANDFFGTPISFKFIYSPIEEVLVYDDLRYMIEQGVSEHKGTLTFLLVENGTKKIVVKKIREVGVANTVVLGQLLIYELTYPTGLILKDIWWMDCEELKSMDYRKYIAEIQNLIESKAYPSYINYLINFSNEI
ncbi:MAG: hypothetical protein ACO2PO_22670 [Candidatus Calescibacterium sp.]|jgi:hypothetical protein